MRNILFALGAIISWSSLANAQVRIELPQIPGVTVEREEPEDYWRRQREGEREAEWRRREEYREEHHRREEWVARHCVRDWQGQEFCRR
jgi:hypothetical protein